MRRIAKSLRTTALIAFISNYAVNSMRVSTELYYVDVRNEFALDALHTLTARCGCSPFRYRCQNVTNSAVFF